MRHFGFQNILRIPVTLKIVSDCWKSAEESLQYYIQEYRPGANEEFITEMFHGELAKALIAASQNRLIARAFLADLTIAFPALASKPELEGLVRGLVADVTLHKRETEKMTGGDIGFMILRPQVEDHGDMLNVSDYRRGILCQAKLKRSSGKWGSFTQKQKKVLPERLPYLGLLLYSYKDEERRQLSQFQWQLCNSASSINAVTQWLKHDSFPSLITSDLIIKGVGNGQIGTDNNKILDEIVSPAGNPLVALTD